MSLGGLDQRRGRNSHGLLMRVSACCRRCSQAADSSSEAGRLGSDTVIGDRTGCLVGGSLPSGIGLLSGAVTAGLVCSWGRSADTS